MEDQAFESRTIVHISELHGDKRISHDTCLKQKLSRVGWTIHTGTSGYVLVWGQSHMHLRDLRVRKYR